MRKLEGKVCVITGGAGSIGLASAQAFLDEGARVMLVDLRQADLDRALAALASPDAAGIAADVGNSDDVRRYVEATLTRFGRIDVLFSNAGNAGMFCPVTDLPDEVFDQVLAVHVRGAFLACKHGLPAMNDGGSIIITSSIVGVKGDAGGTAYITAKHAQVGLMRCVAKEAAARRIRVNTIHPGPVANEFQANVEQGLSEVMGTDATKFLDSIIPLGRHARPQEIARAVLFLAGDDSSFTTGTTFMVDGGLSA